MALDKDTIKGLVDKYYRRILAEDEIWRATNGYDPAPPEFDKDKQDIDLYRDHIRDCLRSNDFDIIKDDADKLLRQAKELHFDKTSLQYHVLCRELLKANLKVLPVILNRMKCIYDGEELADWIPDDLSDMERIAKLQSSPIVEVAKTAGRNEKVDYNAVADELRRMISEDPSLKDNSRAYLGGLLTDWCLKEYDKEVKPETISGKPIMISVFDELLTPKTNHKP
jgi:hypothetical protein